MEVLAGLRMKQECAVKQCWPVRSGTMDGESVAA
jgi:hypothetical protein